MSILDSVSRRATSKAHPRYWPKNRKMFRRFREEEDGNATIEFVIWFPLMVFLLVFSVQTSMVFFNMNRAWDVARDITRKVAVGELSYSEAEQMVVAMMSTDLHPTASVTDFGTRDVMMNLTITPLDGTFGSISKLAIGEINVRYVMRKETDSNTGGT